MSRGTGFTRGVIFLLFIPILIWAIFVILDFNKRSFHERDDSAGDQAIVDRKSEYDPDTETDSGNQAPRYFAIRPSDIIVGDQPLETVQESTAPEYVIRHSDKIVGDQPMEEVQESTAPESALVTSAPFRSEDQNSGQQQKTGTQFRVPTITPAPPYAQGQISSDEREDKKEEREEAKAGEPLEADIVSHFTEPSGTGSDSAMPEYAGEAVLLSDESEFASPPEIPTAEIPTAVEKPFVSEDLSDFEPDPELLDTTLFDVYLGDRLEARALVHFVDDYCLIETPEDVVDQLEKIKKDAELGRFLSGWFRKKKYSEDMGMLECDTATFRLVLNLGPEYLRKKELSLLDRVPDPKNELAVQQRLRTAVAGDLGNTLASSFQSRTIASKGKSWAVLDGTYVNENGYEIDEASVSRTIGSFETTLGLLRTEGQFFASSVDYTGLTIRTSPNVFLNRDTLRGSTIEVFIPSRSRVEFYRGRRLLAVEDLEYGLQEIDTSNFPQGSYDVEIVITEDTGRVIRENRLFTKSGLLEAGPIPIFFLEAGTLRDRTNFTSVPVGQLGLTWRLLDFLQLQGSLYGTEDLQFASTEFTGLYRGVIFQGGLIHSNKDDAAYTATVAGNIGFLNWNLNVREAIKGFQREQGFSTVSPMDPDPIDPFMENDFILADSDFDVLPNTLSNISGSVGMLFGDLRLRYLYNSNESSGRGVTQRRYSYGPRIDWTFFRRVKTQLNFQTSMFETEEGRKLLGFLSFNYRFGRFSTEGNLQHRNEELVRESRLLTGVNYDSKTFSGRGTRARLTDELVTREDRQGSGGTVQEVRNRIEVDHTNSYSQSRGFIRDLRSSNEHNTSVGVDLSTNFTVDGDASVMVSSPPLQDSMVLVKVQGNPSVGLVEIVINGQVRDTIRVGETTAIGLQPFAIYRLNIRPSESAGLLEYDSDIREFSLFPGNVVKEIWSVEPVVIGVGRIVDASGNPLPWTRIKGLKHYTATEEDGFFQAELSPASRLYIEKDGIRCDIKLPVIEKDAHVQDFGDLVCSLGDSPL